MDIGPEGHHGRARQHVIHGDTATTTHGSRFGAMVHWLRPRQGARTFSTGEVDNLVGRHRCQPDVLVKPATLLTGAPIAKRLRSETATSAAVLRERAGVQPMLVTVMIGYHPSAAAYRRAIQRSIEPVGILHRPLTLPIDTAPESFVAELRRLNADPSVTGVLVLTPLSARVPPELVQEHLSPLKDVDGITPTNAGRLHLGLPSLRPSTPQGGIELLDHYGIEIAGAHVVIVGRSNVVGRPLATMLSLRDATVTVCHRQTKDLARLTRQADIVALAAGHPGLLVGGMVKPGAVVLDFGVNVVGGALTGDADGASVADVAGALTPVPGGTGPVTTLVLARNIVAAGFAGLAGTLDHVAAAASVARGEDQSRCNAITPTPLGEDRFSVDAPVP